MIEVGPGQQPGEDIAGEDIAGTRVGAMHASEVRWRCDVRWASSQMFGLDLESFVGHVKDQFFAYAFCRAFQEE